MVAPITKSIRDQMDLKMKAREKSFDEERLRLLGVIEALTRKAANAAKLAHYYETGHTEFDEGEDGWGERSGVSED